MLLIRLTGWSLCFLCLLFLAACSPSLSPLYRDFEVQVDSTQQETAQSNALSEVSASADREARLERVERALTEAGWETKPGEAPNVVAAESRTINNWGLYRVIVTLEAVPLGEDHVRLYVHPYRQYVFGRRSKMPFLSRRIERAILPDLVEAFEANGFTRIGTPRQRDRMAEAR